MAKFRVVITWSMPYPMKWSYDSEGSNFSAGIGKALRKWRKTVPRKRIDEIDINVIKIPELLNK